MARRLILYDVIPLSVSWPLTPGWTALVLALRCCKSDELEEFYVHVDGQEGHPPHRVLVAVALTLRDKHNVVRDAIGAFLSGFGESAKIRFNVVWLRGHGTSGKGFLCRYRVSEHRGEVEKMLWGEGDAEGVLEVVEYDEMAMTFGDVLGFGGHVTRDWGFVSWESERGPEFMMLERS